MDVFDLEATLKLDIDEFEDGLKDAERLADRFDLSDAEDEIDDFQDALDGIDTSDAEDAIDDVQDSFDSLDSGNVEDSVEDMQDSLDSVDSSSASDEISSFQDEVDSVDTSNAESNIDGLQSALDGVDVDKATGLGDALSNFSVGGIDLGGLADLSLIGSGIEGVADTIGDVADQVITFIESYGDASAAMTRQTGATGEALEDLNQSARKVADNFHDADQSTEDIANSMGNLNTRFGYTGDALENAGLQVAEFTEVTGQDGVTAGQNLADIMNKLGLRSEDTATEINNMTSLMEDLTTTSQMSGLSVDTLEGYLKKSSVALNDAGISTESALSMFGRLGNVSQESADSLNTGMTTAVRKYSDELGDKFGSAMEKAIEMVQNAKGDMSVLDDEIGKTGVTISDFFGSRNASKIVEGFGAGTQSVKDYTNALKDNIGTIEEQSDVISESGDTMATVGDTFKSVIDEGVVNALENMDDAMGTSGMSLDDLKSKLSEMESQGYWSESAINSVKSQIEQLEGSTSNTAASVEGSVSSMTTSFGNMEGTMSTTDANINASADSINSSLAGVASNAKNSTDDVNSNLTDMSSSADTHANAANSSFNNVNFGIFNAKVDSATNNLTNKTQAAADGANEAIQGINWDMQQHIAVPHWTISGDFNAKDGTTPTVSTSWYAKAMNQAMVLDNPTIFGMANGSLLGGGEAGAEVISGEEHLMDMISEASGNTEVVKLLTALLSVGKAILAKNNDLYIDGKRCAKILAKPITNEINTRTTRANRKAGIN